MQPPQQPPLKLLLLPMLLPQRPQQLQAQLFPWLNRLPQHVVCRHTNLNQKPQAMTQPL